jgi:hypothetical protein
MDAKRRPVYDLGKPAPFLLRHAAILVWGFPAMIHRKALVLSCLAVLFVCSFAPSRASAAWKEKVLYSFQGIPDGAQPVGGIVFDAAGNLYGATTVGGASSCRSVNQCGTVFQLVPPIKQGGPWKETVLYIFKGNKFGDGATPAGGLIIDQAGNLYGTTAYGGTGDCVLLGSKLGCGAVYELSPPKQKGGQWTEKVLYSFPTAKQGYLPQGDLVFDGAGNLYGATEFGGGRGTTCNGFYQYCGAVFELSPPKTKGGKWTERVLHGFAGIGTGKQSGDGADPNGRLLFDRNGNLYGTTYLGGYNCPHNSNQGCGTAFELAPPAKKGGAWTEKLIHRFNPTKSYEAWPMDGLMMDKKGRLLGTTHEDTVFRLSASSKNPGSWTETLLYSFTGNGPSYALDAPVIVDATGNLYSTVYSGSGGSPNGNVFRLRPSTKKGKEWTIDVLYNFAGAPDGAWPAAGLIFDNQGSLYSTSQAGGSGQACQSGCGTVFELSP